MAAYTTSTYKQKAIVRWLFELRAAITQLFVKLIQQQEQQQNLLQQQNLQ